MKKTKIMKRILTVTLAVTIALSSPMSELAFVVKAESVAASTGETADEEGSSTGTEANASTEATGTEESANTGTETNASTAATGTEESANTGTEANASTEAVGSEANATGTEEGSSENISGESGEGTTESASGESGEGTSASASGESGEGINGSTSGESEEETGGSTSGETGEGTGVSTSGESGEGTSASASGESGEGTSASTSGETEEAGSTHAVISLEEAGNAVMLLTSPSSSVTLSAKLYETSAYSNGSDSAVELTTGGASITDWDYQASRYLQIELTKDSSAGEYTLVVDIPRELYVVGGIADSTDTNVIPAGCTEVKRVEALDPLTVNGDETYSIGDSMNGTFAYTIAANTTSCTIQLELKYDPNLWDKTVGTELLNEPFKVYACEGSETDEDKADADIGVLRLTSAKSGNKTISYSSYSVYKVGDDSSYSGNLRYADVEESVMQSIELVNSSDSSVRYFYPEITLTVNYPFYTKDGVTYYLSCDTTAGNLINLADAQYYTVTENSDGSGFTVTMNNVLFSISEYLATMTYTFPDTLDVKNGESYKFTGGSAILTGIGNTGYSSVTVLSVNNITVTYLTETQEDVRAQSSDSRWYITNDLEDGVITYLQGYAIKNYGLSDSVEKTISVEFADGLLVTTMNLYADWTSETYEIKYTLIDKAGNNVYLDSDGYVVDENTEGATTEGTYTLTNKNYGGSAASNLYNKLTTDNLNSHYSGEYYFKSVTYTIESVGASCLLGGVTSRYTSYAGNYFGMLQSGLTAGTSLDTQIKISSPSDPNIDDINIICRTVVTDVDNPSFSIEGVVLSESSIQAGESVQLSGRVQMTSYQYGYNLRLNDIHIGVLLPTGVSVNTSSISLKNCNGDDIEISNVETKECDGGMTLYIITPSDPDFYIAYYSKSLGANDAGSYLTFSMQLDTDSGANQMSIDTYTMLYVSGGKNVVNTASGGYKYALAVDTYDLNGNGNVNEYIGGMDAKKTKVCVINANQAVMNIYDSISITSSAGGFVSDSTAYLLADGDEVTYSLTVNCTGGGSATDFVYYIPIPNKTLVEGEDSKLVGGDADLAFNLALQGAARINLSGNANYVISYTTQTVTDYASVSSIADGFWYTADDIASMQNWDWSEVTAVRLTADGTIENGVTAVLSLDMKYSGDNYPAEAGMTDEWKSCGYYTYKAGSRTTSGVRATDGVAVVLNYSWSNEDSNEDAVTLTAAKDMEPTDPNVRIATVRTNANGNVDNGSFPAFKNAQTFTITKIETTNVTLQTSTYMTDNADTLSADEANSNFGITVYMTSNGTNGDTVELVVGNELGTSAAKYAPQFTFTLYNADALTDVSTVRYVTVTLTSDKGVTIVIKIDINRELAAADDPVSAITGGKQYVAFSDKAQTVTISQDSAFTAQFSTTYIPNNYDGDRTLTFSTALPEGTTLLLIDYTDSTSPGYWYYKVGGNGLTSVTFAKFAQIGTTDTCNYTIPTGTDDRKEVLLLIVDFSGCDTYSYLAGNTSCDVTLTIASSKPTSATSTLNFVVAQERTFSLTDDTTVSYNETFTVSYESAGSGESESKYEGRALSLVVSEADRSPSLPDDAYLIVSDGTPDSYYYRNADGQFIIPLDPLSRSAATSDNLNVMVCSTTAAEAVTLDFDLWVSATSDGTQPLLGEKVVSIEVKVTAESSSEAFKVTGVSPRLVHKSDLGSNITVSYSYADLPGNKVTVELQEKSGQGYATVTTVMTSVDGSTAGEKGVFTVESDLSGTETGSFTLALSSAVTKTDTAYRLLIKVLDSEGETVLEVPYNFIVISAS